MVISRCEIVEAWEVETLEGIHQDIQSSEDRGKLSALSTLQLIREGQRPAPCLQRKEKIPKLIRHDGWILASGG